MNPAKKDLKLCKIHEKKGQQLKVKIEAGRTRPPGSSFFYTVLCSMIKCADE